MNDNTDMEMVSMAIIANSGEGRRLSFEALRQARDKNFEKADELIKQAEGYINEVHKVQMDLLVKEANGEKQELGILLIHAQDHFMTSLLAYDLICEMIEILKEK